MKHSLTIHLILALVFLCTSTGRGWATERHDASFTITEGDVLIIDLRKATPRCSWETSCCSLYNVPTGEVTLIDLSREKHPSRMAAEGKKKRAGGFQVVLIDAEPSLFLVNRQYSTLHQPLPRTGIHYLPMIQEIAEKYAIDPQLIMCVIEVESGFNPFACSPQNAMGLMQIIPETAQSLNLKDPFDPYQNIMAGVKYLCLQLSRFGSIELALAAYNAGPGAVEAYGGIPPYRETQDYVRTILDRYYHGGIIP
jgi:hypothetical protein